MRMFLKWPSAAAVKSVSDAAPAGGKGPRGRRDSNRRLDKPPPTAGGGCGGPADVARKLTKFTGHAERFDQ